MFVGSPALMSKSSLPCVFTLDSTNFTISPKITLFGVTHGSNHNFSHFISRTIQSSNSHIQALKQVRKFLLLPAAVTLTDSVVISKLDYCDSLLCDLSAYIFFKL